MIELYRVKAITCAILAVATGLSSLGLMWFIVFSSWPAVIGFVIMLIFQLMLMVYFVGNMTYARVHANIEPVEE